MKSCSMLRAQIQSFSSVVSELKEFFPDHFKEVNPAQSKIDFDLNYEVYHALEAREELLLVTLREENELAAYAIGLIMGHLHAKNTKICMIDNFYVAPRFRKKWAGVKLFKAVEEACKSQDVQHIFAASTSTLDASILFERLKFKKTEIMYSKFIGV